MTCIVVPTNPTDAILDARVVYLIQQQIATLSWLDACYGIAEVAEMKKDDGSIEVFPRVYANLANVPQTYKDVRYDDSLKAQAFFERDSEYTLGEDGEEDQISYSLSIVVWANLYKVDPLRSYDFTDQLAGDILRILKDNFDAHIDEYRIDLRSASAYSKYTMSDVENRFITLPYTAFRISFRYTEFKSPVCYTFTPTASS